MTAPGVIGRDEELGALHAFLSDVGDGPAALVLTGAPGIGKTILWAHGVREAERRFGRVLAHRSAEAEASLSFTGLSDLVAPVLEEVAASLPPLRRRALEVALLLAEPGDSAPDPRAIGLALLDTLNALAATGPLVLALDDVQWLDSPSAAVLQIALRRLGGARVGLLATLRSEPGTAVPFALESAFPEERLERRWLSALSLDTLRRLLDERLGLEVTPQQLARIQEMSAGNAFFALELGRELARTQSLGVPEGLRQLLVARLARLPAEAVAALLPVAALTRPTIELVTAARGRPEAAMDALDAAVRQGLVEIEGSRVRFAHPLLASVCYDQASLRERRAVHAALAETVTDIEERARHLARAADGPDAHVAAELEAAADHAATRGATGAAAELCELAAESTPSEDAAGRRRRLLDAAGFHRLAGHGDDAVALLRTLLEEVPSGTERADILFALVVTMRGQTVEKIELAEEALANARDDDARSAQYLAHRVGTHLWNADVASALVDARAALEKAERVGDPALIATTISRFGTVEPYAAEITPGLLERGVELERRHALPFEYTKSPLYALIRLRMRLGEIEGPRAELEDLDARAAARGDEHSRVMVLWPLAMLEWLAGRWQRALEHSQAAYEITEQTRYPHAIAWVGRVKAVVEADLGRIGEARASVAESLEFTRATGNELDTIQNLATLGRIELAVGNIEAAGAHLRALPGRLLGGGIKDPTIPAWADAIETLVSLGELVPAREYLEAYERSAERLGSPWALGTAARCRGLVAGGDLDAAFASFERSIAHLEAVPYPCELGRTLLCLGSARRRARQKGFARDALERALGIFDELGARLWAAKVQAELGRISGRRRASGDETLTEMELRVSRLAAAGRSNKEIAAELHVSVHTVSTHLSHVYRKLGIRSRAQLATAKPLREAAKV